MKTYFPKEGELNKYWYLVNAEGAVLGRLAAKVAAILRGKTKPTYTPHADTGDFIIIVNAEKVKLTGNKLSQKTYKKHSGYPGGLKVVNAKTMLQKNRKMLSSSR
jgi:large subunit ribosomal protein L13